MMETNQEFKGRKLPFLLPCGLLSWFYLNGFSKDEVIR